MNRYDLVPELHDWETEIQSPETLEGWVSCHGSFSLAAAYASIVWPTFVEIRGMVFRDFVTEASVAYWLKQCGGVRRDVESTLNHLHLMHVQEPGQWTHARESQLRFLGETMRASWSAKLALDFPSRSFDVVLIDGTALNLQAYQVYFYEKTGA